MYCSLFLKSSICFLDNFTSLVFSDSSSKGSSISFSNLDAFIYALASSDEIFTLFKIEREIILSSFFRDIPFIPLEDLPLKSLNFVD
jgi:hypothetical protein